MKGFVRISAAVPRCRVADVEGNRQAVLELWSRADEERSALVVFPELALSAYTARDLFFDHHLLSECMASLQWLAEQGAELKPLAVVGLPLRVGSGLYNVAAALQGGKVLALVPKSYLPNYREFEEARWFRPGVEVRDGAVAHINGECVPFGTDLLLHAEGVPDFIVGLELCEDYWVHAPPSIFQVSAGATVVCNLSASNFTIGKAELRRLLARSISDRGKCAYAYVAAGPGESSTDVAFDADAFICENGREMAASQRFSRENQLVTVDVDLELLVRERLVTTSFGDCCRQTQRPFRRVPFACADDSMEMLSRGGLRREVTAHPFLPKDPSTLATRCWEIFEIQTHALVTRLQATGIDRLVLGVSGGLDSTHAALVCAAALDLIKRPRAQLHCITMPGFATTDQTRSNAERLVQGLRASLTEVSICEGARLVLDAVGHPATAGPLSVESLVARLREDPRLGDVTLENVQARMRTLVLMTLANQLGALVVGTGDLSEKALGWSTYAGDHIAMYDVNAGVPKTLIQFVIRWVANTERVGSWADTESDVLRSALLDTLETPISPELLPGAQEGEVTQLTEAAIGPYELHDFYLYHFVRHGARPSRLLDLAQLAFAGQYQLDVLKRWAKVFLRRFFDSQFKRSCTADAPKVGMVALSPRGDWRMPSDAEVRGWLREVDEY